MVKRRSNTALQGRIDVETPSEFTFAPVQSVLPTPAAAFDSEVRLGFAQLSEGLTLSVCHILLLLRNYKPRGPSRGATKRTATLLLHQAPLPRPIYVRNMNVSHQQLSHEADMAVTSLWLS